MLRFRCRRSVDSRATEGLVMPGGRPKGSTNKPFVPVLLPLRVEARFTPSSSQKILTTATTHRSM